MKQILWLVAAVMIGGAPASGSQIDGSFDRHHTSGPRLERHAERFSLDGVACVSRRVLVKDSDGKWATDASVDCQE